MKVVQNLKKELSESIGIISVNKYGVLKKINLQFKKIFSFGSGLKNLQKISEIVFNIEIVA